MERKRTTLDLEIYLFFYFLNSCLGKIINPDQIHHAGLIDSGHSDACPVKSGTAPSFLLVTENKLFFTDFKTICMIVMKVLLGLLQRTISSHLGRVKMLRRMSCSIKKRCAATG